MPKSMSQTKTFFYVQRQRQNQSLVSFLCLNYPRTWQSNLSQQSWYFDYLIEIHKTLEFVEEAVMSGFPQTMSLV